MSYTARDVGQVGGDPGPYVAIDVGPSNAAAYTLDETGLLKTTRAEPEDLSTIEPTLPTLSLGNNKVTANVIVQGNLGVEKGTLLCGYDTSGPSGSCLVSWQPVAGVISFIEKQFVADEMIGPAVESGGFVWWVEFDWVTGASPEFNLTIKKAKGDLTTSLTTVAIWGIDPADLTGGASGYALDGPFEAKILVADSIQVAIHTFEQSGAGDIWYWWRIGKGGSLEARQTIPQSDYNRIAGLGHDAGLSAPLGCSDDSAGLSLQKNNESAPENDESQWPASGSWVSNIWQHCSINADESEALLYFDSIRRLIRDRISGVTSSDPATDITVTSSPSFDVVAFR